MARGSMGRWCGLAAGLLLAVTVGCRSTKTSSQQASSTPTGSEFDQGAVESTPAPASASRPELKSVYFDYDRSEIRSDARSVLSGNADTIKGNTDWGVVTVEGHCDERGSEEYNLALGERRALAVKDYLISLGVPASRLRVTSYGESKPFALGSNERAWAENRRAHFQQP